MLVVQLCLILWDPLPVLMKAKHLQCTLTYESLNNISFCLSKNTNERLILIMNPIYSWLFLIKFLWTPSDSQLIVLQTFYHNKLSFPFIKLFF